MYFKTLVVETADAGGPADKADEGIWFVFVFIYEFVFVFVFAFVTL